jgi:hypothetical protein
MFSRKLGGRAEQLRYYTVQAMQHLMQQSFFEKCTKHNHVQFTKLVFWYYILFLINIISVGEAQHLIE